MIGVVDIHKFRWGTVKWHNLVVVSGGFDPLHVGHLDYIRAAKSLEKNSLLVAVVNGDDFLVRKKRFALMPADQRVRIMAALRHVDIATIWESDDQTVSGALQLIRPKVFAKSGEWTEVNPPPEVDICLDTETTIEYGVGEIEIESSPSLIKRAIASIDAAAAEKVFPGS